MLAELEAHGRACSRLFLSLFLTLSMVLVGLTLIVGAGAVLIVRAYVQVGERMADMSAPDMDTSVRGIVDLVAALAREPGIHHFMFWTGAGLAVVGAVLTVIHVAIKRSITRRTRDEIARITIDQARARARSGRG